MSALAPKGLVSAVLISIPVTEKIPGAERAQEFTYFAVVISILVTAVLIPLTTRKPFRSLYHWIFSGKLEKHSAGAEIKAQIPQPE